MSDGAYVLLAVLAMAIVGGALLLVVGLPWLERRADARWLRKQKP